MATTKLKVSQLQTTTSLGSPGVDTLIPTEKAVRSAITAGSNGIPIDGWIDASAETWTYASATTFTISGDVTATYTAGVKLKLTQTTVKYFYVVSSSYGAPNTTVTVTGGTDYSVANAAISANYYSRVQSPAGFPDWFNYTPTLTASVSNPTMGNSSLVGYFRMDGRTVTMTIHFSVGNSGWAAGSGNYRWSLPITPVATNSTNRSYCGSVRFLDAGTAHYTATSQIVSVSSVDYFVAYPNNSGNYMSHDTPIAWASGDTLHGSITYAV